MDAHGSPSDTPPIEEYLTARASSDIRDGFVAPKKDVVRRVAQEIERSSGSVYSPLTINYPANQTKKIDSVFMPADPSTFVQNTLREITRISKVLSSVHAKKFDLRFDNPQTTENLRGEQIWVAARYTA